jgi:hypothetical protein
MLLAKTLQILGPNNTRSATGEKNVHNFAQLFSQDKQRSGDDNSNPAGALFKIKLTSPEANPGVRY